MCVCVIVQYTLAIMNIGSPSCGMNAAARGFVRLALTRGCRVLGIRFGFEGLVQDNVIVSFVPVYILVLFSVLLKVLLALDVNCISVHKNTTAFGLLC